VWETFVLDVLEQRLKQCRDEGMSAAVYSMHLGPLTLFMDLLLAASQKLRPTPAGVPAPEPIAIYYNYTAEECALFRDNWGPVGPLYTPFIMNPADMRQNYNMHTGFCGLDAVADAAGELHKQMQQLLYPQDEAAVGLGGSSGTADGSSSSSVDVWQQIVETTSLGYAVRAATANQQ
jgi:hypothetical protein